MRLRLLLATLALLPVSGVAMAQDSVEGLRAEVERAKRTIEDLQARLRALESSARAPGAIGPAQASQTTEGIDHVAATGAVQAPRTRPTGVGASILPPRDSVSDPSTAASRQDSSASPTDPELKGFMAIPGTETMFRIGGYAKLDAINDFRAAGDKDQFITATIPVGSARDDVSNFNMHAKQTRFSFEARRPTTQGNLRFYLENDFFGSADGYDFRLRHAYGQLGNTYAGYGYSTFMDADALPDTLDFEGPGGAAYLLVAGMHHSFSLGMGNSITLALEDPDSQVAAGKDGDSTSRAPDVLVSGRIERDWGHLQLSGVLRRLSYISNVTKAHTVGGGLSLSGSASMGERDLLLFGLNHGSGMARYVADISGSNLDAAVAPDGHLEALTSYGGYFGYTHYWSDAWRSNLVYGELRLEDSELLANDDFRRSRYGAANLIWSPAPSWTMGIELLYGQLQQQDASKGDVLRLQGSLQYNFIK